MNISDNNFRSAPNLTTLVLNWENPTIFTTGNDSSCFDGKPKDQITLKVPVGTKALYEAHALWGSGFVIEEQ